MTKVIIWNETKNAYFYPQKNYMKNIFPVINK